MKMATRMSSSIRDGVLTARVTRAQIVCRDVGVHNPPNARLDFQPGVVVVFELGADRQQPAGRARARRCPARRRCSSVLVRSCGRKSEALTVWMNVLGLTRKPPPQIRLCLPPSGWWWMKSRSKVSRVSPKSRPSR